MKYINRPHAERLFNQDKDVYLVSKETGKAVRVNRASIARFFSVPKSHVTLADTVSYGYSYLGKAVRYSSFMYEDALTASYVIQAMKQRAAELRSRPIVEAGGIVYVIANRI